MSSKIAKINKKALWGITVLSLALLLLISGGFLVWVGGLTWFKDRFMSPSTQAVALTFPSLEVQDPEAYLHLHPATPAPDSMRSRALSMYCDLTPAPLREPVNLETDRAKLSLPILSLGLDENGTAPAAPPLSQTHTIGWYNLGPQIGSTKGKIVLTGHTYSDTIGVGNELLAGVMKHGEIIKVSDNQGNNACYRYRDQLRIDVATYNPDSDLIYDEVGAPQIAIVVCDNFVPQTSEWLAREVFYADLLTEENVDSFDK